MLIILLALAAVVVFTVLIYNELVRSRNLMREAWSGIDVQLKRRHDLVPRLVDTVRGYATHERGALEEVTALRARAAAPADIRETAQVESGLSQGIRSVLAVVEHYPDLKANQSFLELQKNLVEIEDQIQLARRYYNGTVRNYNIQVQSFPANLIAARFHFPSADFFELAYATERETPDVAFGG